MHSQIRAIRRHYRLLPYLCFGVFCWIVFSLRHVEAFAEPSTPELTAEEQSGLAERFAPILVFHPEEEYFPCSPLFAFEAGNPKSASSLLGTPESRTERYLALTLDERAKLATVYYRAYRLQRPAEEVIVVEYWFYYVQDTYRVRGNLLPLWFDGSHPNDLEHIQIVLRAQPNAAGPRFEIAEIDSGAHEGRTPANRRRFAAGEISGRPRILVERGSHANASDTDGDGVFTPHVDGDSGYKMIWGIRDRGIAWIRYNRRYMDERAGTALVFSSAGSGPSDAAQRRFSYQLEPTERLNMDVTRLRLTERQRKEVFQTHVSWFTRIMGRSNGNANALLSPPKPNLRTRSFDAGKYSSSERGFLVGITNLMPGAGVFVGGRYSFQSGFKYIPDLMFEADGIVNKAGNRYLSTDALLTYPIDATTKFMFGTSVVTDSIRYKRTERDWVAAGEVRLGRMRIYGASRTWGKITRSAVDFRMSFFF